MKKKPNILFILVDELRFPSVFPQGVNDAGEFLEKYMPNVYRLWKRGVKFSNYQTAASACTPARGTILTGLYSQQTWLCCTLTADPTDGPDTDQPHAPILNSAFPTYGKLLRQAGYRTPYIGKWHVSLLDKDVEGLGLEEYGFNGNVYPDPVGYNLQGTVGFPGRGDDPESDDYIPPYRNDKDTADAAVKWLREESQGTAPWCLTVGFVNPHDREFFWGGTEFLKYNTLLTTSPPAFTKYSQSSGNGVPPVRPQDNPCKTVPPLAYREVPLNWESAKDVEDNKPSTQYMYRKFGSCVWGGASDDDTETEFTTTRYPRKEDSSYLEAPFEIGTAPYSYWKRGLDSYTQLMGFVDERVGQVMGAVPKSELDNTVIVFASDHGEYAGAHGFLSGKLASAYKEAYNVPLIVVDPTGRFTAEPEVVRDGLVSSVDFLRMLVSMGYNGRQEWLEEGENAALYGSRHDILPMLKSSAAPGRDYVLLVTDELVPGFMNFNNAPNHIIGYLDKAGKLGTYANWKLRADGESRTDIIEWDSDGFEYEYYDYVRDGQLELINRADDPKVKAMIQALSTQIVPNELRAALPAGALYDAGEKAKNKYLDWATEVETITLEELIQSGNDDQDKSTIHAFGRSF